MRPVGTSGYRFASLIVRLGIPLMVAVGMLPMLGAGKGGGRGGAAGGKPLLPLKTTLDDFFLPGTQPDPIGTYLYPIVGSIECSFCHGYFEEARLNPQAEPYRNWVASMMGQASRDPIFFAALAIANQDMNDGGDTCLRCHTPAGWLGGRSTPTDGSGLGGGIGADFDGVTCNLCHRIVNPTYVPGQSPPADQPILSDLAAAGELPAQPHTATYVVDTDDVRRAPRDPGLLPHPLPHPMLMSPFHKSSSLCATCHDVSNPQFMKQRDGTYRLTAPDAAHPTQNKYDMFPVERTFSEWSQSAFANGGVQLGGLFGGSHPTGIMESCQDCHMPKRLGPGCIVSGFPVWPNMPQHAFNGANSWVLRAVYELYPFESGLRGDFVEDSIARSVQMLRDASTLQLTQSGPYLKTKITNFSGHKLPSGYPEGRRIWINIRFLNSSDQLIAERGAYNPATAVLSTTDTKVYEAKLGLDAYMSAQTGLPAGESFHFLLNNTFIKDNRIPPIGFTNAGFASVQAAPVGATYADGQNWDEAVYQIPSGTARAVVTVYHQTTSKEYIEFLRDANTTNQHGQEAHDLWVQFGRSAPVDMDSGLINFTPFSIADLNGDGAVNSLDLGILLSSWSIPALAPGCSGASPCYADVNSDGHVNSLDLGVLLSSWTL